MTPAAASRPAASDQAIISCINAVATGPTLHSSPFPDARTMEDNEKSTSLGESVPPTPLSVEQLEPSLRPNPTRTHPARVTQPLSSADSCRDVLRHRRPPCRPRIRRSTASGGPTSGHLTRPRSPLLSLLPSAPLNHPPTRRPEEIQIQGYRAI